MHVMIHTLIQLLMILVERLPHCLTINHDVEGGQKENDKKSRDAVTPDIDTFIVNHKQTSKYLSGSVKIDSISMSDIVIVLHELGSSVVVSNIVFVLSL